MRRHIVSGPVSSIIAVVSTGLFVHAGFPSAQAAEKRDDRPSRLERAKKELERRKKITEWVKKEHPPQQKTMMRTFKPILEGNKSDYKRNRKLANEYAEKARETDDDDLREKYAKVAKLFKMYGKQNKRVVKAIENGEGQEMNDAFDKIKEIEKRLYEITRNRYKRKWFTPEELRKAAKRLRQREE